MLKDIGTVLLWSLIVNYVIKKKISNDILA